MGYTDIHAGKNPIDIKHKYKNPTFVLVYPSSFLPLAILWLVVIEDSFIGESSPVCYWAVSVLNVCIPQLTVKAWSLGPLELFENVILWVRFSGQTAYSHCSQKVFTKSQRGDSPESIPWLIKSQKRIAQFADPHSAHLVCHRQGKGICAGNLPPPAEVPPSPPSALWPTSPSPFSFKLSEFLEGLHKLVTDNRE